MATMIDEKPSLHGEAMLWATLQSSLPEHDIVYNNREIEGREFDCCVLLEGKGILIIEVKGWQAERIKVEGVDRILVEGYEEPQRSPKKQARAYRFALLNSIKRRFNASPLVLDMVCYPFISKREYFETRLDIVTEEAVTLFKEDLDDSEAIRKKIEDLFATSAIAHSAFTRDLQHSVRLMWEPSLKDRQTDETKTYSKPERLARVAEQFPKQIFIGAHFGGYQAWDESEKYLIGKENVYIDTSSSLFVLTPEYAAELIRRHGAERVLFGTDYPMWDPTEEIERFMRMPLTEEEREMIFAKNLERLLDL